MAKKKFDYFDYFKEISGIIGEAAEHLNKTLNSFDVAELKANLDTMHEIEHKADSCRHDMMQVLMHEFIPPIESEDIAALAQCLDTVVDTIEDVLLEIYMLNVTEIRPAALEFAGLIMKCTKGLDDVISEFKNYKNSKSIRDAIVSVNNFESEGDALLVECVRELSTSDETDRSFFVWNDVYNHFEECLDSYEEAANVIEEVIMKNS